MSKEVDQNSQPVTCCCCRWVAVRTVTLPNLVFTVIQVVHVLVGFVQIVVNPFSTYRGWITLNGGPAGRAGWRAVLPNEKHEFSAGWRPAQKGGPAGFTTGRASGLHIKAGCTVGLSWTAEKSGSEGCPFLQPAPPFSAARRPALLSAVQTAEGPLFSLGNTTRQPARPAGPQISVIHRGS